LPLNLGQQKLFPALGEFMHQDQAAVRRNVRTL
jgi:hypothetical protein